jgi:hypothetical protein
MSNQDAIIKKIKILLGLYKFNTYKLIDNKGEIIIDGELENGCSVYYQSPDGQIPLPDGEYELEDTTIINTKDGIVQEIKYESMEKPEKFVEAMLKDGTLVKSPTFDVNEPVMVVDADGKEAPAPDGEHELMLKDAEGKDVVFKIIVKDGKIVERENVEKEAPEVKEEMGDLSIQDEGADYKKQLMEKLDFIVGKIEKMETDYEELKSKVGKFSKEPAGEPVKQIKNIKDEVKYCTNEKFSMLVNIRQQTK